MRLCLPLLLIWLLPATAYPDLTFGQLAEITEAPDTLEGRFTQKKYLVAVDAVIDSSGVFSYRRGEYIRWGTLVPIRNELLITPASISSKMGAQELLHVEKKTSPAIVLFNEILFSVLTADWERIADYFVVSGDVQKGHWRAELVPVDKVVKQAVHRIEIMGDTLIREITLYESGGDHTFIHFDSMDP